MFRSAPPIPSFIRPQACGLRHFVGDPFGQRGRGGGLVEALAGAESLFGTKTSSFLVKSTTFLAILFFVLSTFLAFLSKQKGRSLLDSMPEVATPQNQTTSEQMLPAETGSESIAVTEQHQEPGAVVAPAETIEGAAQEIPVSSVQEDASEQ